MQRITFLKEKKNSNKKKVFLKKKTFEPKLNYVFILENMNIGKLEREIEIERERDRERVRVSTEGQEYRNI